MRRSIAIGLAVLMAVPAGTTAQVVAEATRRDGSLLTAALGAPPNLGKSLDPAAGTDSQPEPEIWNQLQTLPVGARLRITLLSGSEIEKDSLKRAETPSSSATIDS